MSFRWQVAEKALHLGVSAQTRVLSLGVRTSMYEFGGGGNNLVHNNMYVFKRETALVIKNTVGHPHGRSMLLTPQM